MLVAGSVGNALPHTLGPSKSKLEIEPVLASQMNAMIWRAANIVSGA